MVGETETGLRGDTGHVTVDAVGLAGWGGGAEAGGVTGLAAAVIDGEGVCCGGGFVRAVTGEAGESAVTFSKAGGLA